MTKQEKIAAIDFSIEVLLKKKQRLQDPQSDGGPIDDPKPDDNGNCPSGWVREGDNCVRDIG